MKIILVLAVIWITGSCKKENQPPIDSSIIGHPKLLLFEGEEQQIHDLIESDEAWKKMHLAILEECDSMLDKPDLQRVMVGRRLLGTSREFLRRVFYLSYAYRMTEDERYLLKATSEMVGFECEVPAKTSQAFEVIMIPKAAEAEATFLNVTLDEWKNIE